MIFVLHTIGERPRIESQVHSWSTLKNWIRHGHRVCCYAEAAEKYLDSAYAAAWDLLKASDSTYYDVLREKFYDR